jgi:hypothetical protein
MYSLLEVHSWFVETFKSKDNSDFIEFIQNFDGNIRMPREEEAFVNLTVVYYLNNEMSNQYIAEMFLFDNNDQIKSYQQLINTLSKNLGDIDGWSYDIYHITIFHPKTHTPTSHDAHALHTNSTK